MSLFFAINSTGGCVSESREFKMQIQPDRVLVVDRLEVGTDKIIFRRRFTDLKHAEDFITAHEHGYRTVNMDGVQHG